MTTHPLPIARALAAALPRGTRAAGPNIPPNMRARLREAEARAWSHSTLAGYLWENGERASRAIALASANNCCKQTEKLYLASTGREAPGNPNLTEKMNITAHHLAQLQSRIETTGAALNQATQSRVGIIDGKPSIDADRASHYASRAEMLAALKTAGPRLRSQFHAEQWEDSFNPDGSPRV